MIIFATARRSPADRYQDMNFTSRVESATPHGLVAILYEELTITLEVLARAIGSDATRATQQHARAITLLSSLIGSLDLDGGGELARTLYTIYRAMQRRLNDARTDPIALNEVREGVADLAEAWNRIV